MKHCRPKCNNTKLYTWNAIAIVNMNRLFSFQDQQSLNSATIDTRISCPSKY